MKRFIKICEYLFFITFLVISFFTKNKLSIILALPVIYLVSFTNKIKIKNFPLFLFLIAFLIRIISILYLKVDILDDFKTMLDASESLIKGNLNFLNTFYFHTFSYQLGHVLYQSLLLKIFDNIFFLKLINSLVTSLIVVFIYLITKELFTTKIAKTISLTYLFYFYPIYLNSILTNQHLPALIYLTVIYLLIHKKQTTKLFLIIGLLLSLANILRTESIVFIISIIISNFLNINKNNLKPYLKNTFVLLVIYFISNFLISELVFLSPLKIELKNNAPYWKFYCGLSYKYNGKYNREDEQLFFNNKDSKNLLIERIKEEKFKLPILFLKKEVILWTQTNYDLAIKNKIPPNIYNFLLYFNQGYLNLIIFMFVISLFPNKNKNNKDLLLIKIILAIYFGVYMFIEISPRYAYILHILVFLLLGNAFEKLANILKQRKFEANI